MEVEAAVLAVRWTVTVVGLDPLAVLVGIIDWIISTSSSSSLLDSLRRCNSYRLVEGIRCRCRSENDDASVLARTVEVRHASNNRNDKVIGKRGARECEDLGRLWATEAGRDVEAIITNEEAASAKNESGWNSFMYKNCVWGAGDEAVQGSSELAAQTITRLNVFHLNGTQKDKTRKRGVGPEFDDEAQTVAGATIDGGSDSDSDSDSIK